MKKAIFAALAGLLFSAAHADQPMSCTAFAAATKPNEVYASGTGTDFPSAHDAAIQSCQAKGGENCTITHSWCVAGSPKSTS